MEPFFNHKTIHFCNQIKESKLKLIQSSFDDLYLVIIACHLNSHIKYYTLTQNLKKLEYVNTHFIIVYSKDQPFNDQLLVLNYKNCTLIEVDNDYFHDFSKWYNAIKQINVENYSHIIFTNDSFLIKEPISYFYKFVSLSKKDLVAFSSSNEYIYHYQTYLFSIQSSKIQEFVSMFERFQSSPNSKQLLIKMEINLYYIYDSKTCFVDLGNLSINNKKNIFFHNPKLYQILSKENVIPFVKLKMLDYNFKPILNNII